jgi:hypothetical protein
MAKLIHRAAALLGCSLILAFVTACGSGSAAELTEGAASATPAASAPSDSLLPEGTYRTPELTGEQLIATGVKACFTRAQAEHALALDRINQTATFTLTLERGQWTLEMPSGSGSRTPIHSECARATPSARWASSSGKARRSAGSSCHTACWSQAQSRCGMRLRHGSLADPDVHAVAPVGRAIHSSDTFAQRSGDAPASLARSRAFVRPFRCRSSTR